MRRDALLAAEIDVGSVSKNELISDMITFVRVDDSLIYRVEFV